MAALTAPAALPLRDTRSPKPRSPEQYQDNRNLTSQEKSTFKSKLQHAIAQAEEAELLALREAQLQDKKSLAISMLIEGQPQAFVDFFQLTHTPSLLATTSSDSNAPGQQQELPQDALVLLKAQLVRADAAQREGLVEEVYGSYKHLAKYFAQLGRLRTAEFFFKRCLHVSREAAWLPGELEANLALGVVYEELSNTAAAIACHERRLELASDHSLQAEMETAFHSLTCVYLGQAERQEKEGNVDSAIESYNKCLRAADRAGDYSTAAKANYRLGLLYYEQSKWQDAMYYFRKFIDLSGSMDDPTAEGNAHTMYAQCLQQAGDVQGAIRSLQTYLETAGRAQDQSGPALACCSLGILFYDQQKFQDSVNYFEKFFDIARGLPDRRVLDVARFNLGVARGAVRMSVYMDLVNADLPKLIMWKNARTPFMADKTA